MPNEISNKELIAKNAIMLYIRMFVTMAVGLYTSRVILSVLGVTDYGIFNVVGGVVTMFTFINGSISLATSRHLTYALGENNADKVIKTFKTAITIHLIISIVFLLLSEPIGLWFLYNKLSIPLNRMDAALWVFHYSVMGTALSIIAVPFNSAVIAHEKMSVYAWLSILDVTLKLAICYCLLVIPNDSLKTYAVLYFLSTLMQIMINVLYCHIHFKEARLGFVWDKTELKGMSSFAGWTLLGQLAYMGFTQGLNILLNMFFGPNINAARGIAVQVQGFAYKFVSGFQTAFNPQLTKTYACHQIKDMHKLLYMSSKLSFYLLLVVSLPIILETPWLLELWLKDVPKYTVDFFRIIILVSFLETLSYPLIISAMATGNVKNWNISIGLMQLMIIPVSYVALKIGFPAISVFIVHLFFSFFSLILRIYLLRKMIAFNVKEYIRIVLFPIGKVVGLTILVCTMFYFFFQSNTIVFRLGIMCLCIIASLASIILLGINSHEREVVIDKVRKYVR